jgi:hypothetical protein
MVSNVIIVPGLHTKPRSTSSVRQPQKPPPKAPANIHKPGLKGA